MFTAVALVLFGPCVRVDWMQRAVGAADIQASNAAKAFAVAVVAGRAFAAEFDSLRAAGWGCVGGHGSDPSWAAKINRQNKQMPTIKGKGMSSIMLTPPIGREHAGKPRSVGWRLLL